MTETRTKTDRRDPIAFGRCVGWLTALGLMGVALMALGRGALALPPGLGPGDLDPWLTEVGPIPAAFAAMRALAIGVVAYLAFATVVEMIAAARPSWRAVAVLSALTPRLIRRIVSASCGLSLGASTLLSPLPALAQDRPTTTITVIDEEPMTIAVEPGGATMIRLDDEPDTTPATAVMVRLPPNTSTTAEPPIGTDTAPALAPTAFAPADVPATWTVRRGDHLWSIAETTVEAVVSNPTDADIAAYHRALITANSDRLAVAGDADLIYPGQVFSLPAVTA